MDGLSQFRLLRRQGYHPQHHNLCLMIAIVVGSPALTSFLLSGQA
jgi:hypothetical protein